MELGMLLFTGGRGKRLGGPKQDRPHPLGGTWGGRLVDLFQRTFPGAPVHVLGLPLSDHPGLPRTEDPGLGPAVAIGHWAREMELTPGRWWLVACDQVHWTSEALSAWYARAQELDPDAERWVVGRAGGRLQPFGSFFPGRHFPELREITCDSLHDLMKALPVQIVEEETKAFQDVDTPEELSAWLEQTKPGP